MSQPGLIKKIITTTTIQAALLPTLAVHHLRRSGSTCLLLTCCSICPLTPELILLCCQPGLLLQCQPKESHACAVKMIAQYLSRTIYMGIIFTPNDIYHLFCFVDTDFASPAWNDKTVQSVLVPTLDTSTSSVVVHCCGKVRFRLKPPIAPFMLNTLHCLPLSAS